jgi:hypothetical protein
MQQMPNGNLSNGFSTSWQTELSFKGLVHVNQKANLNERVLIRGGFDLPGTWQRAMQKQLSLKNALE